MKNYGPSRNDDTYVKARLELERYDHSKKDRPAREWVPSYRTASGVRFGYWRWNK
jgi:hypothetical protein